MNKHKIESNVETVRKYVELNLKNKRLSIDEHVAFLETTYKEIYRNSNYEEQQECIRLMNLFYVQLPVFKLESIKAIFEDEVEDCDEEEVEDNEDLNEIESSEEAEDDFKWIQSRDMRHDKENEKFINSLWCHKRKPKLVIEDESIFDKLAEEFPNFIEVINFYKSQFRLSTITKKSRIQPIMLLGSPGIGKTMFAKRLAELLNTGFTFIDMGSTSTAWVLTGLSSSWHGAKHGKAFDSMLTSRTASPIILLDELEKSTTDRNDPKVALYQLLEEANSKRFVDEFVNFPVDLSNIIYIASANSIHGLTDALLSRFTIFEIPNPTPKEQRIILQNIYKNEVGSSNVFEDNLSEEVINSLLDVSLREAKLKINRAISNTILEVDMAKLKDNDFPKIRINDNLFIEKKVVKKSIGF